MLNKEEICVIVGAYPTNSVDAALLSLTIESFKRQGYDICLTSHTSISKDIQKECKYFLFSDENYLLKFPTPSSVATYYSSSDIYYQTNNGNRVGTHAYAILMNIKNAVWFLRNKPYKKFIYIEPDTFLNSEDHKVLESKLEETNFMEKNTWFFIENIDSIVLPVTSIFGGDIEFISNKLNEVDSIEKYFEICSLYGGYAIETLFSILFLQEDSNGHIEYIRPRELFKSEWLGVSTFEKGVFIPGLDTNFGVDIDIVKQKHEDEPNNVCIVLNLNPQIEPITLNFYQNNNLTSTHNLNSGPLVWWIFNSDNVNIWKVEVIHNGKVIKTVERTTEDIFWNVWSFIEFKNNSSLED